ncbi:MAG: DUF1254 domain-containing protein [Planctomycetota bacterium]|jgi:hypothetical protein
MKSRLFTIVVLISVAVSSSLAAQPPKMKMTTEIPESILTPDKVETSIGTFEYFDGFPTGTTAQKCYDYIDTARAVEVFLNCLPVASLVAMRDGFKSVGVTGNTIGVYENLMDSKSLFLTPNTESIYAGAWLDLSNGPMVVESPPNTLGIVDDFWFRYVADMGNAGPDQGRGGRFLFLPPGYDGPVPSMGFHVFRSQTYNHILLWRGFLVDGDPKPGVENIKNNARIYPLAKIQNPPEQDFINLSGKEFNTIHANDYTFFEEVNRAIQEEPVDSGDPELLGQLASIGIKKGVKFKPDDRMKRILSDAAAIGNGIARTIIFDTRGKEFYFYKNSAWKTPFVGGSHLFIDNHARLLDARTMFFYYATMITPAMATKMVGTGSAYAGATVDSEGNPLDGSKNYKLTLPKNVPAKDFWSIVVYDNQTRSMLQTDHQFPSLNSQRGVQVNKDGTTDIYFGPKAPEGKENNWIQTVPGKGWNMLLRLYGPLEPWFDQTWRPGEIELMK